MLKMTTNTILRQVQCFFTGRPGNFAQFTNRFTEVTAGSADNALNGSSLA